MPSPESPETNAADAYASTTTPPSSNRRRQVALALGGTVLGTALIASGYVLARADDAAHGRSSSHAAQEDRQAEVKQRGSEVMPFDLDKTEHIFTDLSDGGDQRVRALDPADASQIRLIREHLQKELAKFRVGDFGDPTTIHGSDMPGLAELKAGAGRVTVTYTSTPDGARLRYATTDPILVQGIHSWFKAQSTDHDSPHNE